MSTNAVVAAEIARLHECFERWFHGDDTLDFAEMERSLADDFTFVPPSGNPIDRPELLRGLRESFGTRPIRIRIERPVVHWEEADAILATYEEWQDFTDHTTGRRSTVLFSRHAPAPGGLWWRHVHETWIQPPPDS